MHTSNSSTLDEPVFHRDLHALCIRLRKIHSSIADFEPLAPPPPIIDASVEIDGDEDSQWSQQENIPGIRLLKESVKSDLERLEAFLANPDNNNLPALSTNSPYLISVWNEVSGKPPRRTHRRDADDPPGVKVDIVCDGGVRWIRVNTIKNARILAEFREIDSYLTDSGSDSSEDSSEERVPTLAQKEFDNSVLRMGRSLLAAAKENILPGHMNPPAVTLRLTRLNPFVSEVDPRIAETIQGLTDMGIDVQLGERPNSEMPIKSAAESESLARTGTRVLEPTTHINLDLSILIALVSDLTHAPLPTSMEDAETRFIPSQRYIEWKKQRIILNKIEKKAKGVAEEPNDLASLNASPQKNMHARALTNQLIQEMGKGLLQDMSDRLSTISPTPSSASITNEAGDNAVRIVKFWTTKEARDRCLRIVSKIGGPNERRRADALFPSSIASPELFEENYWLHSRHSREFIPLLPVNIYPSNEPHLGLEHSSHPTDPTTQSPFFRSLARTCREILAQETAPHPRALPSHLVGDSELAKESVVNGEIQRAVVTKANPKLTAHTVQSLLWGAELGWTTLTANKSSVKAILREIKQSGAVSRADREQEEFTRNEQATKAAFWIVDPRSLAEGQRGDFKG